MRHTRPAQPAPTTHERPLEKESIGGLSATWRYGWRFKPGSLWIGAHWSSANQRLCINLLPCLTVWVVLPGGIAPS